MKNYCDFKFCKYYEKKINIECIDHYQRSSNVFSLKAMKEIDSLVKGLENLKRDVEKENNHYEKVLTSIKDSYEEEIKKFKIQIDEKQTQLEKEQNKISLLKNQYKEMKMRNDENELKLGDNQKNIEHYKQVIKQLEEENKDLERELRKRKMPDENLSNKKPRKINDENHSFSSLSSKSSSATPERDYKKTPVSISPLMDQLKKIGVKKNLPNDDQKSAENNVFSIFRKIASAEKQKINVEQNKILSSTPKVYKQKTEDHSKSSDNVDDKNLSTSKNITFDSKLNNSSQTTSMLEKAYIDFNPKTPIENKTEKKEANVVVKREILSPTYRESEDLFASDVICIGDMEDKIYSVNSSQNDEKELKILMSIEKIEEKCRNYKPIHERYCSDSSDGDIEKDLKPLASFYLEKRLEFEDECFDCNLFYDEIAQKQSTWAANAALRDCTCQGHSKRRKYLEDEEKQMTENSFPQLDCEISMTGYEDENLVKEKESLKKVEMPEKTETAKVQDLTKKKFEPIIRTRLDLVRKKKARGLEIDERDPNDTPSGFWDMNISPRKRSPLKPKLNRNGNGDYFADFF